MPHLAKYGVEYKFVIPVPKKDDTDFAATGDWAPVVGDVKASKNGGDVVNVAADPPAVAVGGSGSVLFQFTVSATEMEAKEIVLQIIDAAVENQAVVIQTYGHGSAEIIGDWNTVGDWKATGYSTHDAAGVWSASGRALSTPSDYMADVSGLSTHSAANVWTAGSRALTTPSDYMADVSSLSTLDAAGIRTAMGLGSANLDTQLSAKATVNALAGLITTVGTAGGGLTGLGGMSTTMKAQIRTQAVAALVTDTYDELGGVPADDSSIKDKIEWLFIRSKHYGTQGSSLRTVRNADSDTVIATAAISDDGSTFTREKWTS